MFAFISYLIFDRLLQIKSVKLLPSRLKFWSMKYIFRSIESVLKKQLSIIFLLFIIAALKSSKRYIYDRFLFSVVYLTHFQPISNFYRPRKYQKTGGFLKFSRGIEVEHWLKMGLYTF